MNAERRQASGPRAWLQPPVRRMSDVVSPVGKKQLARLLPHAFFFCGFKCLLFIVTLFVIAAKQISPQGAIKLELNSTELHWKEKRSTAGSLATASWCKEPELEEYAHTISAKRAQTKVPQILNFPTAFVSTSFFYRYKFLNKSNCKHPLNSG